MEFHHIKNSRVSKIKVLLVFVEVIIVLEKSINWGVRKARRGKEMIQFEPVKFL